MARSPRERVLAFASPVLVVIVGWNQLITAPNKQEIEAAQAKIDNTASLIQSGESRLKVAKVRLEQIENPNQAARDQIETLEERITRLSDREGQSKADNVASIPPDVIVDRVQAAVNRAENVYLVRLFRRPGNEAPSGAANALTHKQFELIVEADYANTARLFQTLEGLDFPLLWRGISYEVEEYPIARTTVRFDIYATESN